MAVMDAASTTPSDADRLAAWEQKTRPAIIAAALVPMIGVANGTDDFGVVGHTVEFASWAVFVVDFVVHLRLRPRYLRTGMGWFDLVVVVLTSPWYLLPGVEGGQLVTLLRLARIARVMVVGFKTPMIRRTLERLGRPFIYVAVVLFVCAAIVEQAEDHKHGFESYGDALWWGVVTITTVGYGDLVPESDVGRVMAAVLMLTGVALLGTVAASLASLFRLEDRATEGDEDAPPTAEASTAVSEAAARAAGEAAGEVAMTVHGPDPRASVLAELRALRAEVAALRAALDARD